MLAFFYPVHRARTDGPELPEIPRADQICSSLMIPQWIMLSMRPVPHVNCALSAFINVVQSPWHTDLISLLAHLLLQELLPLSLNKMQCLNCMTHKSS